ncbi:MAG: N-6 DNA methylase [Candidatus Aminicenantia bacterium]
MDRGKILELQNIDFDDLRKTRRTGIEANVKKFIVEPILEELGYISARDIDLEFKAKGFADYALLVNGKPKVIVEAKSLEVNLADFVEQAYGYASAKQVGYFVLTNGKEIRLYKTFIENVINPKDRLLLKVELRKLETQFSELYKWISKESLTTKKLDKLTEEKEKIIRESVTAVTLIDNLKKAKRLLVTDCKPKIKIKYKNDPQFKKNLEEWIKNTGLDINNEKEWIDKLSKEVAYSFINKLYFYRIAEDRGIVKPKLTRGVINVLKMSFGLREIIESGFREILKVDYRAIFEQKFFDTIEFEERNVEKIIVQLSEYNFKNIDSDILGKVYELHIDEKERKELGQFYTPEWVINHILDKVKITTDKKILDPACGSGGFLIRVYDRLKKQYEKEDWAVDVIHEQILKNNIYGIDINPFAVQLSGMNLALRGIEYKTNFINVVEGDSLITSLTRWAEIERKNINNITEKIIIEEDFPKRFDIVVSNPPYVQIRNIRKDKIKVYKKFLKTAKGRFDLFSLFIERGITFLENGGMLGFIVSNTFLSNDYLENIRNYVLDTCVIKEIVWLGTGVFDEATVDTAIIILKKETDPEKRNNNTVTIGRGIDEDGKLMGEYYVTQSEFYNTPKKRFIFTEKTKAEARLLNKIVDNTVPLENIAELSCGIQIWSTKSDMKKHRDYLLDKRKNKRYKKVLDGRDIYRYGFNFDKKYVLYDKRLLERAREERFFLAKEKIIMRYIGRKLIATLDKEQYYGLKSVLCLCPLKDSKYDLRYLLGLINSKLMTYYYKKLMGENIYPRINLSYVKKFPIKQVRLEDQKPVISKVDKILDLSEKLNELNKEMEKTTKLEQKYYDMYERREEIEKQIQRTDDEINDLVFELYGFPKGSKYRKMMEIF